MLTLFKNITEELTDLEKESLVPMLIEVLNRTNETNRFPGRQIITWFTNQGYPISKIRLCKMVSYIRIKNLISGKAVIGAQNGYFVTEEKELIKDQIESLQGRIDAMAPVIDSLKAQLLSIGRSK